MSSYALPLKEPAALLLAPARFLQASGGRTPDSARDFLRSQPGFLGRRLPLEAARKLAAAAAQAGFECLLVDEADLKAPPHALEPDRIAPKGSGFEARAAGAITFVPYDSVTVFCAAAYDAPAPAGTLRELEPGLFAKLAGLAGVPPPPVPAPRRETFFIADLVAPREGLRLLLRPENLDFSPLGPARSPSSLQNFRTLLDTLSAPAFKAVKNRFLQALLAGEALTALKVASPEAAELEVARLLLLARRAG